MVDLTRGFRATRNPILKEKLHETSFRRMVNESWWQKSKKWVDRNIRPFFYLLLLCSLGAEAWVIFFASPDHQAKYITSLTVLLSAVMATCGWMWTGHINRRSARKNQAMVLLLHLREQYVHDIKKIVYQYIKEKDEGKNPPMPLDVVERLLGLYEMIGIAVMNGTADEEIIYQSQSLVFLRLYTGLREHIEERQKAHRGLYCHFEYYAKTWNSKDDRFTPSYAHKDGEFIG